MDGRDFLVVAQRLVRERSEADWRTAAGRAYYALMQEGRSALQQWGFVPRGREDVHRFVRLRYLYATNADLKKIGFALDSLSSLRNQADYRLDRPGPFVTPTAALNAVQDAANAITLLDQIDGDPARRAAAVAAIQAAFPP